MLSENTDNINPKDVKGVTPFHEAAKEGHWLIRQTIIERVVDKNPKCNIGMTPLHHAAENGHVGTYQLIIKHVEDKNPENALGLTPLHFAEGHKNFDQIFKTAFSYDVKIRMPCKRPSGS